VMVQRFACIAATFPILLYFLSIAQTARDTEIGSPRLATRAVEVVNSTLYFVPQVNHRDRYHVIPHVPSLAIAVFDASLFFSSRVAILWGPREPLSII